MRHLPALVPPLLLAAATALSPAAARAHEVLHQIERGRAIAVRAYHDDGDALAGATYEVYAPASRDAAFQKGRTDRNGWLAFVPDAAGKWRVKIVDDTGHGVELEVDAAASATDAAAPPSVVLRPLAGVLAVAALFGLLFAVYRTKRGDRPRRA